jgi:hypothetical protein
VKKEEKQMGRERRGAARATSPRRKGIGYGSNPNTADVSDTRNYEQAPNTIHCISAF